MRDNGMITARFSLIGVALVLAACSADLQLSRIESGRLLKYGRGDVILERQLTKKQAADLSLWLIENGQGWSFDLPVTYAPDILLYLKHKDSFESGLYVYDELVISASGNSQLKRSFSKGETKKLKKLLGLH